MQRCSAIWQRTYVLPQPIMGLVRAEYSTDAGWDAWHPKSDVFRSAEGQKVGGAGSCRSSTRRRSPRRHRGHSNRLVEFLRLGALVELLLISANSCPFGGPGTARFRVGSRVERLETTGECSIVQAELDLAGTPTKEAQDATANSLLCPLFTNLVAPTNTAASVAHTHRPPRAFPWQGSQIRRGIGMFFNTQ